MKRLVIQRNARRSFIRAGTGTIVLPTGVGKTRVGCEIIQQLYDKGEVKRVLIVTPTTVLKETNWPETIEELKLDSYSDLLIHIECKHTAYKITEPFDLIVIDEIHNCLSPLHKQCLFIDHKYLLGLTASPPYHNEALAEVYREFIPTIYHASLRDCIRWKICPPFKMYNVPVELTRKERLSYTKWDASYERAKIELLQYIKAAKLDDNVFDFASKMIKNRSSELFKPAQMFYYGMTKRKEIIYNSEKKIAACINIINSNPDKKWIVFSKRIDTVDKVSAKLTALGIDNVCYHSKMKIGEKALALEKIKEKSCRVLISAEALIVGYNLPELDGAICIAGVATEIVGIQSLGRINRIIEGKLAIFINLYCNNTREKSWVHSRTVSTPSLWIDTLEEIEYV